MQSEMLTVEPATSPTTDLTDVVGIHPESAAAGDAEGGVHPLKTCCICSEELAQEAVAHACSEGHLICSSCYARHIRISWQRNAQSAASGVLHCFCAGCGTPPLTTKEVVTVVTDKAALATYVGNHSRTLEARCYGDAHCILLAGPLDAADALVLKQEDASKKLRGTAAEFRIMGSHTSRSAAAEAMVNHTLCNTCNNTITALEACACDKRHNVCSSCLIGHTISDWCAQIDSTGEPKELRCLCTGKPLAVEDVVRVLAGAENLAFFIDLHCRAREVLCYRDALVTLTSEGPSAAADALLHKQLQKLMSAARMCPHCKFGPIDFFGCDDLVRHHEQELRDAPRRPASAAVTRNGCPRCKFFASTIDGWDRWDGVPRNCSIPHAPWEAPQPQRPDQPQVLMDLHARRDAERARNEQFERDWAPERQENTLEDAVQMVLDFQPHVPRDEIRGLCNQLFNERNGTPLKSRLQPSISFCRWRAPSLPHHLLLPMP
jgi:hypothetical protein